MGRSGLFSLLSSSIAVFIGICVIPGTMAFSVSSQRRQISPIPSSSITTDPYMSGVARKDKDGGYLKGGDHGAGSRSTWIDNWRSTYLKLPPPPEDGFIMIGDLLSLCVYGFMDHFFVQVVSRMMVRQTLSDPLHHLSRAASLQVSNSAGVAHTILQVPVWLDLNAQYTNHVLEVNLSNQLVNQYSPLLEPTGAATCLLIACWLVSGWFHHAFAFRNTLDCSTERALLVTVRTWLTTCALLFGIVLISQKLCGCDYFYLVKRGDLDYVVDSASVPILWRFLAASLLGSGRDD